MISPASFPIKVRQRGRSVVGPVPFRVFGPISACKNCSIPCWELSLQPISAIHYDRSGERQYDGRGTRHLRQYGMERDTHAQTVMGHTGRYIRRIALRPRRSHRQRGAPDDRQPAEHFAGKLHLDSKRLPVGYRGIAPLFLGSRRRHRLPENIHRRTAALHQCFGRVCALRLTRHARGGTGMPGIRCRSGHQREYHTHTHHLSAQPPGSWHGA